MALNNGVIEAMIAKWVEQAAPPNCEEGSDEAKVSNARAAGFRNGLNACADQLDKVLRLLGTEDAAK